MMSAAASGRVLPASSVENHLDVLFHREPRPEVLVEARMVASDNEQMPDGMPAIFSGGHVAPLKVLNAHGTLAAAATREPIRGCREKLPHKLCRAQNEQ